MRMARLAKEGELTLENAMEIFENTTKVFEDEMYLNLLHNAKQPEVVRYVFSKSINMNPRERTKWICDILGKQISSFNQGKCELVPGEPQYEIALVCLEFLQKARRQWLNSSLDHPILDLVQNGNLALAEKLFECGFAIPDHIPGGVHLVKGDTSKILRYLVKHGFDMSGEEYSVYDLMKSKKIGASDFELYLKHGLDHYFKRIESNWLVLALQESCFGIAAVVYENGLRLRKYEHGKGMYREMQEQIDQFVKIMAKKKTLAKFKAWRFDRPGSPFAQIPEGLVIEMLEPIAELEKEIVLSELYARLYL